VVAASAAVVHAARAIRVLACEQASGPARVVDVADLTSFPATGVAAETAYRAAGVGPRELDVIELRGKQIITTEARQAMKNILGARLRHDRRGRRQRGPRLATTRRGGGGDRRRCHGTGRPDGSSTRAAACCLAAIRSGAHGPAQVHDIVQQLRGEASDQVAGRRGRAPHNLGEAARLRP
jgi:hypothetical protein